MVFILIPSLLPSLVESPTHRNFAAYLQGQKLKQEPKEQTEKTAENEQQSQKGGRGYSSSADSGRSLKKSLP